MQVLSFTHFTFRWSFNRSICHGASKSSSFLSGNFSSNSCWRNSSTSAEIVPGFFSFCLVRKRENKWMVAWFLNLPDFKMLQGYLHGWALLRIIGIRNIWVENCKATAYLRKNSTEYGILKYIFQGIEQGSQGYKPQEFTGYELMEDEDRIKLRLIFSSHIWPNEHWFQRLCYLCHASITSLLQPPSLSPDPSQLRAEYFNQSNTCAFLLLFSSFFFVFGFMDCEWDQSLLDMFRLIS